MAQEHAIILQTPQKTQLEQHAQAHAGIAVEVERAPMPMQMTIQTMIVQRPILHAQASVLQQGERASAQAVLLHALPPAIITILGLIALAAALQ